MNASIHANPALHNGQKLTARKGSPLPDAEIIDHIVRGSGIEWMVKFNDDGSSQILTLSQIYRYYEFDS